ncbi:MAG: zf-HC2 domain-containing protein, partial [Candidatus Omnitrophota bacterium]|nr:zf-HC2 domain-containing protein [Candidatus Omnitrophota bacterium]
MKECAKIKRLLNKYIDKELDKQELLRVQGHVKECILCKEELDKLYLLKGLIENIERKVLPEEYLIYRIKDVTVQRSEVNQGVIPAQTGIQRGHDRMDARFHGHD